MQLHLSVPRRSAGTRTICYCKDCQTAAHALGAGGDILDAAGGTDVWQTTPDLLEIRQGADQLGILRLSPQGIYRWYARCCNTPLCNTLPRLGLPFVGIITGQRYKTEADATFGRVRCQANTAGALRGQGAPVADSGFSAAGAAVLRRMIAGLVSGRAAQSPLREPDGAPVAPIRVLSLEERRGACPPLL